MKSVPVVLTALTFLGIVPAVMAQSVPGATRGPQRPTVQGVVATIDVSRLPLDLQRIERRFRQGQIREERDGLNLRYFVDVYGRAPEIVLFTPEDNLRYGPVPNSAPTHRDMLEMMTPREFRSVGGINVLAPFSSDRKK